MLSIAFFIIKWGVMAGIMLFIIGLLIVIGIVAICYFVYAVLWCIASLYYWLTNL